MKQLTKKELLEKISYLEKTIADQREIESKRFNKYRFVSALEEELKSEIESGNIEDTDSITEYIEQDIENACIYYGDCWDICRELNATHFELEELGQNDTDVSQLAYFALREYVYSEIDTSELERLIEKKQNA